MLSKCWLREKGALGIMHGFRGCRPLHWRQFVQGDKWGGHCGTQRGAEVDFNWLCGNAMASAALLMGDSAHAHQGVSSCGRSAGVEPSLGGRLHRPRTAACVQVSPGGGLCERGWSQVHRGIARVGGASSNSGFRRLLKRLSYHSPFRAKYECLGSWPNLAWGDCR